MFETITGPKWVGTETDTGPKWRDRNVRTETEEPKCHGPSQRIHVYIQGRNIGIPNARCADNEKSLPQRRIMAPLMSSILFTGFNHEMQNVHPFS